jgi:hypothetical protein
VCRCCSTHLGFVLNLVKIVTKAFFSCFQLLIRWVL